MKKICFLILASICLSSASAQTTSTFESIALPIDTFWNGINQSGGFMNGNAFFTNHYDTAWGGTWSGFSLSTKRDSTTAGFGNQYSAITGGGHHSPTYATVYTGMPVIRLQGAAAGKQAFGCYVTNSTYAYQSMKNGDLFAKKFGGVTGTDPDWFRIIIKGWYQGGLTNDSVIFYLADFRSPDTTQHYIAKDWRFLDLRKLGNIDSLSFALSSTDTAGGFGMNTPAYFCLDDFTTTDGTRSVPFVVNDTASTRYTDSVVIHVLANDTIPNVLAHTITLLSSPLIAGATAYVDSNGNIVYVPAIGIRATDTLYYKVCDATDSCATAMVVITVNGLTNTNIADIASATLTLSPNPAHTFITISADVEIPSMTIVDSRGAYVVSQEIHHKQATIDISALSAGMYMLLARTAEGIVAKRFIKE